MQLCLIHRAPFTRLTLAVLGVGCSRHARIRAWQNARTVRAPRLAASRRAMMVKNEDKVSLKFHMYYELG